MPVFDGYILSKHSLELFDELRALVGAGSGRCTRVNLHVASAPHQHRWASQKAVGAWDVRRRGGWGVGWSRVCMWDTM